jgi:hypothetical protein
MTNQKELHGEKRMGANELALLARDILTRMEADDTESDDELMIVHAQDGAFRRVLVRRLDEHPSVYGAKGYAFTGRHLKEICEALIASKDSSS